MCHGMSVKVRRQLAEVGFSFHIVRNTRLSGWAAEIFTG